MSNFRWRYNKNSESDYQIDRIKRARAILKQPNIIWPTGIHSHEHACEEIDEAELELIGHLELQVLA